VTRAILFLCFIPFFLVAQESAPHPELDWHTIETKHFLVHYHEGAERTAREVSFIAESIHGPITELYAYVPEAKVHFVIRDHDDYSNGAAYFFDNKIEIWAPALEFELRGTHPWLWNVVTHEYTHMIQIQASLKLGRRIPAFYVQWLGYEAERRPDVLYGYPNVLVSYPISGFVVPSWFAEGTAQFNHPGLSYDYWDAHRDMILRMHILEGTPLSWEEMAVFGKTSLGNESAYNAGFSLVSYIVERYGADKLLAITRGLKSPARVTIDGAIEEALGITGTALYEEWKTHLLDRYGSVKAGVERMGRREGRIIEPEGFGNHSPRFFSDGRRIAYISNRGEDYFGLSSMYVRSLTSDSLKPLIPLVRSPFSIAGDDESVYFSRIEEHNPFWSAYSDLYRYDAEEQEANRITFGLRAMEPALSPDGKRLAYVTGKDGTKNLQVSAIDGSDRIPLTTFESGELVARPVWSMDGREIAYSLSVGHRQALCVVDLNTRTTRTLALSGDARDPAYSPDGRYLYFSWDSTGIFNIFRLERTTGTLAQITNVLGGAFQPTVSVNGQLAYAAYTETGYKIALMDAIVATSVGQASFVQDGIALDSTLRIPTDSVQSKPYRSAFSSVSIIPVLRIDNYTVGGGFLDILKPGVYIASFEMLDKMSLFAGASINRQYERDIFVSLEYRSAIPGLYHLGLSPTLTLELYSLSRKADAEFSIYLSTERTVKTSVTYDLFEVDLSLTERIFADKSTLRLMYTKSRYSAALGFFSLIDNGNIIQSQAFRTVYLTNDILSARWRWEGLLPTVDREINPIGRTLSFKYSYEMNKYNRDLNYDYSSGLPIPIYKDVDFHRLEMSWNEHIPIVGRKHTLSIGLRGGSIQGMTADTIFHFYAGGFIGMKGYPFYAIEGNHLATMHVAYRFPIWTTINTRLFQMYFTKLYGSVFADVGNAWNGATPSLRNWKTDAGVELRLEAFSFYAFPTRIFLSGAYGFDQFERQIQGETIRYGKEWRFYLGVLFGFELTDMIPRTWR